MDLKNLESALAQNKIPTLTYHTVIVGSGCAAFNAANSLHDLGVRDIAILTEGRNMGTSRNTGSDKQTYYKLSLASDTPDSVAAMAKTLFDGGCVHGDTALVEAALSSRCFFNLVNLGVPFPHDRYGQYVGYKTDHDPMQRATSCGPLTSKYMTEALERGAAQRGFPLLDRLRVISLLTAPEGGERRVIGLLALSRQPDAPFHGAVLVRCANVIYAVGGPSGIYGRSVYPVSQTCGLGAAFAAGASGTNLTEWQYGIASTAFRWNLSGTYQQVLPRYYSTAPDGSDPREFLAETFSDPGTLLTAVFLKGYQWPFDPRKLGAGGSSLVDMAVYRETVQRGRRVFLDFTANPQALMGPDGPDFGRLQPEAYRYLKNSGVLFGTPVQRLQAMNLPAYTLYRSHGIDLARQPLEIAVCAQHCNGGLTVDRWWQSDLRHLFPVGECAGTFGVYRPGGTALNSTQVGSLRAAQYISSQKNGDLPGDDIFLSAALKALAELSALTEAARLPGAEKESPLALRRRFQASMDACGAVVRDPDQIEALLEEVGQALARLGDLVYAETSADVLQLCITQDILLTQRLYLSAMLAYCRAGGGSRGSYLIPGERAPLPGDRVQVTRLESGQVISAFPPVRPIPAEDTWFENVYNQFLNGQVLGA